MTNTDAGCTTHKDSIEAHIEAICEFLADNGTASYSEIGRHFERYWDNHEFLISRPTWREIDAAVLRALKIGRIECHEHDDPRAREGGAPAEYCLARSAS